MSSSAGSIIYKGFAPTLKIILNIAAGFIFTKFGDFPPSSAKGVSLVAINVALPCLIFSSIVTAFTDENIAAFGSLFLVGVMYEVIGAFLGWFVSEVFYVPQDFQWGILVLGLCSNWGNLPIAVIETVGQAAPFNGPSDVALGTAYISVLVLIMNTTFFPLGVHKLCALDFKEETRLPPKLPFRRRWAQRFRSFTGIFVKQEEDLGEKRNEEIGSADSQQTIAAPNLTAANQVPFETPQDKRNSVIESDHGEGGEEPGELGRRPTTSRHQGVYRKRSRASSFHSLVETTRSIPPTAPLDAANMTQPCVMSTTSLPHTGVSNPGDPSPLLPVCSNHGPAYTYHHPPTPAPSIHKPSILERLKGVGKNLLAPTTISILIGLPVSLIKPLKALFVVVDGWTGTRVPLAPNGKPPLSWLLETTVSLGAIAVPAGIFLLGAGFARLKMPKAGWRELPIAAMIAMTLGKMVLVPIFGIFFVQALRDHTSIYPADDKMRMFVAILTSGTPASINQLVVTQLYNPEGTAHTLAMFLLIQYVCLPIFSTAIAALALYVSQ